jgi:hypothetical protein
MLNNKYLSGLTEDKFLSSSLHTESKCKKCPSSSRCIVLQSVAKYLKVGFELNDCGMG